MTRFRSKIYWFWDYIDFNMKVVFISRSYGNPWDITMYFGVPECIQISSHGEVVFNIMDSTKIKKCNSQSWNQCLHRFFPKTRYTKRGELYVYDSLDKE